MVSYYNKYLKCTRSTVLYYLLFIEQSTHFNHNFEGDRGNILDAKGTGGGGIWMPIQIRRFFKTEKNSN
jgi:hypothetical protein